MGGLGQAERFTDKPYVWTPPNPSPVALPLDPTPRLAAIVLHADTPAEARVRVARVARLGVKGLWLETSRAEALTAAVEAGRSLGIEVSLALRPWALGPLEAVRDPDRTPTGGHGKSLAREKVTLGPWLQYWQERSAFEPVTRELLAPLDPAVQAHMAALARLGATPGLWSVALLDLYPNGYGKANGYSSGSYFYTIPIDNFLSYGDTDAQRAAFFAAQGVDPLDLENPAVRTRVNLRQAWGDAWSNGDDFAKWQAAKGVWSHDAALALARALAASDPARPVLLPGQPPVIHMPSLGATYLLSWNPKADLPISPQDFGGEEIAQATDVQVVEIQDEKDPPQRNRVAGGLKKAFETEGKPLVLDFSSVPAPRLDAVIARWLRDRQR